MREPQERTNLEGFALPSWWPMPVRFQQSSLDFGWWSPVDERWYRELREKYLTGGAQPKSGPEWVKFIKKMDKRARKITDTSREAALTFLRSDAAR